MREPVYVHDEAELVVRLAAISRWAEHAVHGRTDPERALDAIDQLVRAAKQFVQRRAAA